MNSFAFETTADAFLGGRLKVLQPAKGFRSGLDAVLLAAACSAKQGDCVVEAGCGVGVASLCLAARVERLKITGVEIEASHADLARENARMNSTASIFNVITADIFSSWGELEELGLKRSFFDHAMANPPFYAQGSARLPQNRQRAHAHVMEKEGLDRWLRFLAAAAAAHGSLTLIYTAQALALVLEACEGRFGALEIKPIYAKADSAAIRIIISGRKGSRAPLRILPGLILHGPDGSPTSEALALTREGKALYV